MRRTQQERREATITRLIDAAIVTLDELGYSRASANTITARAGLSYGALFRHFPTMSEFMAATARETVRRHTELVSERVRELAGRDGRTDLEAVLVAMRELVREPTHHAVLELTVAARTDEQLAAAMRQTMFEAGQVMIEAATRMVGHESDLDAKDFVTLVFLIADISDSEAIQHPLRAPYPEIYDRRIHLLTKMLKALSPQWDTAASN
ncbi:TetR/AcrR family transcriptional regulator [Nocardia pseudobrasiliensis]|uniref:TetR family transcriptional regulator n=1 Tax=Nocardia pseudobrasiliensis TaxID=45979 RepID=A0A370I6G9_9NOCA|nr:TetR/AcrR family transcriptional regulator [Nocardia pseudobrasiliensis]RDI66318.1 TetR family transcriptional regulator [Nocardia pseudobrasiliensis]